MSAPDGSSMSSRTSSRPLDIRAEYTNRTMPYP